MSDTENSSTQQDEILQTETPAPEAPQLFDAEMNAFRAALAEDCEAALDRFGFALVHSLPPADRLALMEHLGLNGEDAMDFYNQGTVRAMNGENELAAQLLEKALQMNPDLREARFNLALTLQQLGRSDEARSQMEQFSQVAESPADRDAAAAFLAELEA